MTILATVRFPGLRLRRGPGKEFDHIDELTMGDVVDLISLHGTNRVLVNLSAALMG